MKNQPMFPYICSRLGLQFYHQEGRVIHMVNSIGNRISQLRREKGLTQEEMADKLGVTPQAVSK